MTSLKLVEIKKVKKIPKINPKYTIFFANTFPNLLFDKSVIRNVMG